MMDSSKTLVKAIKLVRACPKSISISLIQRHLWMGYQPACRLMAQLVLARVVVDNGEQIHGPRYTLRR